MTVKEDICCRVRREKYFVGHDNVCATYCELAASADGIPGVIAGWKPRVDVWPRATRGAEADVGFFRIPGSRDTYVDAVCSYANPLTYAGCESTAGNVAERRHARRMQIILCLILRQDDVCILLISAHSPSNGTVLGQKKQ